MGRMADLKCELWDVLEKEWSNVLDTYIRNSYIKSLKKDLPYWHCERANVGFLAASIWKVGAIAIEEFYVKRKRLAGKTTSGHCDLWVKYNNFAFTVEAKLLWGKKEYSSNDIKTMFKKTEKQLASLSEKDKEASNYFFSICFITPMSVDKACFDNCLAGVEKYVKENAKDDYKILPYDARVLGDDDLITLEETGKKWPGVIMLIKDSTNFVVKTKEGVLLGFV